jgi:hypothetical protein
MVSLLVLINCETCVVSTSENAFSPQYVSEHGSCDAPPKNRMKENILFK